MEHIETTNYQLILMPEWSVYDIVSVLRKSIPDLLFLLTSLAERDRWGSNLYWKVRYFNIDDQLNNEIFKFAKLDDRMVSRVLNDLWFWGELSD